MSLISGATNSALTLNNLQTSDTGNYSVFVTNDVGCRVERPGHLDRDRAAGGDRCRERRERFGTRLEHGRFSSEPHWKHLRGVNCDFSVTGSALSGTDYQAITSPVLIPPGSSSINVTVTPLNDSLPEGNETVRAHHRHFQ
jgi:hypothetical protein